MKQILIDTLKARIKALDKKLLDTTYTNDRLVINGEINGLIFALKLAYDTKEDI